VGQCAPVDHPHNLTIVALRALEHSIHYIVPPVESPLWRGMTPGRPPLRRGGAWLTWPAAASHGLLATCTLTGAATFQ
jgi:hypothetical protein